MAEMTEAPYSWTHRSQKGDLLTVRGENADIFEANLRAVGIHIDTAVPADIRQAAEQAALANVVTLVQPQAQPQAPLAAPAPPPPLAQAAPPAPPAVGVAPAAPTPATGAVQDGGPPMCTHGPMKWAEGTNKKGQPYRGYYCSAPYGTPYQEKCPAVKL